VGGAGAGAGLGSVLRLAVNIWPQVQSRLKKDPISQALEEKVGKIKSMPKLLIRVQEELESTP